MSEWTSLHDIMQDLSVAQGCMVPAALETVSHRSPPAMTIDEESIEHPLYQCDGGGDLCFEAPDYNLIQKMLYMVREKKDNKEDNQVYDSDLNPLSPDFVPQAVQQKVSRNAALQSILTSKAHRLAASRPMPKDVIPVMFKRKIVKQAHSTTEVLPTKISSPNKYIPSAYADEYYNKYLEKNRLKAQFESDIWSRAEQQMKEIEAKKKLEKELMTHQMFGVNQIPSSFACGLKIIELQQHRHQLPKTCVVCLITSKHGYELNDIS